MSTATIEFLRAIGLTDGLVLFQLLKGKRTPRSLFVPATDEALLSQTIADLLAANAEPDTKVLFSVNSRFREGFRDVDVRAVRTVVLDFDAEKVRDADRLREFTQRVPMTALVETGSPDNGRLYWAFDSPVDPEVAHGLKRRRAREASPVPDA
jgi:hypothetical protein